MTMQTPLRRAEGLGAAKSGTEHFWHERVSAIAGLPLVVFVIVFAVLHLGSSRAEVLASLRHPLVALLAALALIVNLWHMKLGMQVIIEDYVHGKHARLTLILLNLFFCVILGALGLYAILAISFSGPA
jgi:succinate dehydrogenase / fumarate reductase membrane anchor subunit